MLYTTRFVFRLFFAPQRTSIIRRIAQVPLMRSFILHANEHSSFSRSSLTWYLTMHSGLVILYSHILHVEKQCECVLLSKHKGFPLLTLDVFHLWWRKKRRLSKRISWPHFIESKWTMVNEQHLLLILLKIRHCIPLYTIFSETESSTTLNSVEPW